ncbi:nitrilase-related carbon-nitrogen hydrolase [Kordiimonas sediminis]|nr:nitrilase-related carbon-nitrogen hydrolase [Kordiimonas sediminis]
MEPLDYATAERFQTKLDLYFRRAKKEGWFQKNTIVVLPEHIGTWLVASDQKSRVYNASTLTSASSYIAAWHPLQILKNLIIFDQEDKKVEAALFRSRSSEMAKMQYDIFGELAKKYQITLVAGSSILMTPGVFDRTLSYGHGPLFNAGFVFGPDGKPMVDAIRKVHPVTDEVGLIRRGVADYLPTFSASEINFAVLICADSWFADTYGAVKSASPDIIIVPAFLSDQSWEMPWQGYRDDQPAFDGWKADVGRISEGEAWQTYTLTQPDHTKIAEYGMTVFLKGTLWDIKGSGRALIKQGDTQHVGQNGDDGAALYNLWLQ